MVYGDVQEGVDFKRMLLEHCFTDSDEETNGLIMLIGIFLGSKVIFSMKDKSEYNAPCLS